MTNPEELIDPVPIKQKPSCWLIGGLGCLALFVMGSIVLAFVVVKVLETPRGKELTKGMVKYYHNMKLLDNDGAKKMSDIHGALVRYELKKGEYPAYLSELVPDFLPDKSELHCPIDTDRDLNHVSFAYTRPSPSAPSSATVLSLKMSMGVSNGVGTIMTMNTLTDTIGGHMVLTEYQDGKQTFQSDYSDPEN